MVIRPAYASLVLISMRETLYPLLAYTMMEVDENSGQKNMHSKTAIFPTPIIRNTRLFELNYEHI